MIIFIGHNASRSGAPGFLLNFIRWVKDHTNQSFVIILNSAQGPLLPEYEKLGAVIAWNEIRIWQRIARIFGLDISQAWKRITAKNLSSKASLIFCNTSVNGDVLKYFGQPGPKIISRIPEMGEALKVQMESVIETVSRSDKIIAVSETARKDLIKMREIDASVVETFYGTVDSSTLKTTMPKGWYREGQRLDEGTMLVCGCGSIGWRKGTDLFIEVAKHVVENAGTPVKFIWLGEAIQDETCIEIHEKIDTYGLRDSVMMVGEVPNTADYYQECDLFLMCSRQDPFPLVNLEVGLQGMPIICFDQSGGSVELIEKIDPDMIIPQQDTWAMANKVITLATDRQALQEIGMKTKEVVENEFLGKYTFERLYQLITQTQ